MRWKRTTSARESFAPARRRDRPGIGCRFESAPRRWTLSITQPQSSEIRLSYYPTGMINPHCLSGGPTYCDPRRHAGPGVSIINKSPVPLRVQWLDDHQFRSTACFFGQALALLLGKLRRHPKCPVCGLDRRISASTDAKRLAPRRACDIRRRACVQFSRSPKIGIAAWLPRCSADWPVQLPPGN